MFYHVILWLTRLLVAYVEVWAIGYMTWAFGKGAWNVAQRIRRGTDSAPRRR